MAEFGTAWAERVRDMPRDRQILLALVAVLLVGVIAGGVYLSLFRTRNEVLFSDLKSADAATIVAELEKKKIPFKLRDGGAVILVPTDVAAQTRLEIVSSELPLKGTIGFEIFNKSDMGLTEFAQKINYQRALQGELARTIISIDGVEEARVHLALPEQTVFREEQRPPKASVTLLTRGGEPLPKPAVLGIQQLIAASVPDLPLSNVVVLDGAGRVISDSALQDAPVGWLSRKQALEQALAEQLQDVLFPLYPDKGLQVAVSAQVTSAVRAAADVPHVSAGRDFPIHVSIVPQTPLADEQLQTIQRLVETTVGIDFARGDSVSIDRTPTLAPAPTTLSPPAAPMVAPSGAARPTMLALFASILAGLLVLAITLHRWRPGRARLSRGERQAIIDDLKALLQPGEIHARR